MFTLVDHLTPVGLLLGVFLAGVTTANTGPDGPAGIALDPSRHASTSVSEEAGPDRLTRLARQFAGRAAEPTTASTDAFVPEPPEVVASHIDGGVTPVIPEPVTASSDDRFAEDQPLGRAGPSRLNAMSASPDATGMSWVYQTTVALGAVIGLILLVRAVMSRISGSMGVGFGRNRSPVIEVMSRVGIGPRSRILLLRLGGRILVVGESAGGLQTLANIHEGDEVAEVLQCIAASNRAGIGSSFKQSMRRFNREYSPEQVLVEEGADEGEFVIDRARDQLSGLLGRIRSVAFKRGGR